MKIIILGGGQVGGSLAENLSHEDNDITVIDPNAARLQELERRLDIRTIVGNGARPDVLYRAGAPDADMLIAATDNDETNMIACQVAFSLYKLPVKLARIRASQYLAEPELFKDTAIPIDFCISPEILITQQVKGLIKYPAALQVLDFADGKVQLVAVKPYFGGPMVGKTIAELYAAIPDVDAKIIAIYRGERSIELTEKSTIEIGDEVFCIAAKGDLNKIMSLMRHVDHVNKRIMIAGGGNIGFQLAQILEDEYQVKIVDHNEQRDHFISQRLDSAIVLQGDASDKDLLVAENIEYIDVFCAMTNDDEANIMSAMLAKRLGARQVIALVNRSAYIELIEGGSIDIAISPQQATIGSILTHLRQGDVVNVHSLRRGAAEAIEVIAHADKTSSKVVGRSLRDIKLPAGASIVALIRGSEVMITNDEAVVESDDHLVILVVDKKHIHDVEKLFQVSVTYFK